MNLFIIRMYLVSVYVIFNIVKILRNISGIIGKNTDLVHLDRDTGEMVVAGRIDHEQTSWLNMSVRATDSGFPNRSSFVEVFIEIIDENDNNPYFIDSTVSNISISEDAVVGTISVTTCFRKSFLTYILFLFET